MVEGTRSLLKDAILSDPGWALQHPMKHSRSLKLRSSKGVPTPSLCGPQVLVPVIKLGVYSAGVEFFFPKLVSGQGWSWHTLSGSKSAQPTRAVW